MPDKRTVGESCRSVSWGMRLPGFPYVPPNAKSIVIIANKNEPDDLIVVGWLGFVQKLITPSVTIVLRDEFARNGK